MPPQLLSLQQLPNGNIHLTLPPLRPMVRPRLTQFVGLSRPSPVPPPCLSSSPTPSQLLYSFDADEPIYDTPPDENHYEELGQMVNTVC